MQFPVVARYVALWLFLALQAWSAEIEGISDAEIATLAKAQISNWEGRRNDLTVTKARIAKDIELIKRVLHSYGYFDATITAEIKDPKIIFRVTLNTRYKLDGISLVYTDHKDYRSGLTVKHVFGITKIDYDSYVDFKRIMDGNDKLKDRFKSDGFPFVILAVPRLEPDEQRKKAKVVYTVTLNRKAIIDSTTISIKSQKDPKLIEPFVRNRIPWKDGDVYSSTDVETMTEQLMASGIFAAVDVDLSAPTQDPNDPYVCHTTALVSIEEAKLRDISVGAKYGSTEHLGLLLSWSYYNIDGRGSKLSTIADITKKNRLLKVKYDMYDVFYKKQDFANSIFYVKDDVDAYKVSMVGAESMLWQTFFTNLKIGAGACYENATTIDKVVDKTPKTKFKAAGIPVGLSFDTTDNYLDPSRGIRCSSMMTPYFGTSNVSVFLTKASMYIPMLTDAFKNTLILSLYSKFGSIFGKKSSIPRHKFFFAGGNNSVRGYGYQKISDLSDDGKPIGGESLFEFGVEPRFRATDDIGIVVFFEGGNVRKSNALFKFKDMLFGYGAGVRYYTPFGQIRLDLAFPTKIRKAKTGKRVDSRFNLYVSVGQAF
ncbi:MAG: BamA/TamA family outer membrane protein [Holosporales bacterium]|nr:BamA/TamA family outer membrane protein [Holosporales bacterium]